MISKASNTLTVYADGEVYREYPVATGAEPALTPEGTFHIVRKAWCPAWTNPDTGRTLLGCSPSNPLGSRWLGLDVGSTAGRIYGIHGTNRPELIGGYVSHGCIRMHNADVEELFDLLGPGTEVKIEP